MSGVSTDFILNKIRVLSTASPMTQSMTGVPVAVAKPRINVVTICFFINVLYIISIQKKMSILQTEQKNALFRVRKQ